MNTPILRRFLVTATPGDPPACREVPATGPAPTVLGRARIYEGPDAPTPEQMAALFAAVPVPQVITPAQLRVWLIRRGIPLTAVDDAIAALPAGPGRDEARARWEYSTEIHRGNPLVAGIAAALRMDDAAVDDAFVAAALL